MKKLILTILIALVPTTGIAQTIVVASGSSSSIFGTPVQVPDGTVNNPGITWTNESTTGWYRAASHDIRFSMAGADLLGYGTNVVTLASGTTQQWGSSGVATPDIFLFRDSTVNQSSNAGLGLQGGSGVNAQTVLNVYKTGGVNYERLEVGYLGSNSLGLASDSSGSGIAKNLLIKTMSNNASIVFGTQNTSRWVIDGASGDFYAITDNTYNIGNSGASRPKQVFIGASSITAGSATGLTIVDTGSVRDLTYKISLATTAFICNATTCDVTIGTLPANTWLINATASLTQVFACTATCTSTALTAVLGKGAGGTEYLASMDIHTATTIFGDADAEMGTLLVRASAIQGGTFNASTQTVVFRLVSGVGNIGNGVATNLSTGAITIWLTTRTLQ